MLNNFQVKVFWVFMLRTVAVSILGEKMEAARPSKCWYPSTSVHGITS